MYWAVSRDWSVPIGYETIHHGPPVRLHLGTRVSFSFLLSKATGLVFFSFLSFHFFLLQGSSTAIAFLPLAPDDCVPLLVEPMIFRNCSAPVRALFPLFLIFLFLIAYLRAVLFFMQNTSRATSILFLLGVVFLFHRGFP